MLGRRQQAALDAAVPVGEASPGEAELHEGQALGLVLVEVEAQPTLFPAAAAHLGAGAAARVAAPARRRCGCAKASFPAFLERGEPATIADAQVRRQALAARRRQCLTFDGGGTSQS